MRSSFVCLQADDPNKPELQRLQLRELLAKQTRMRLNQNSLKKDPIGMLNLRFQQNVLVHLAVTSVY